MTDLHATLQQTLGDRYVIEREIGGGMSRVFVAQERGLPRRVALKVLPPELHGGVSVDRFRREIQLVASLHHPHIVPLLAAGEAGEFLFYTMPFVEGETLRARLAREKRLNTGEALGILDDVLDALAYAHRHAGLEAEAGDTAEAIALFGAFENFSRYDLIYAGPGHLHRAALYERRGNTQAAVAEYNRFLEMWQDCDAEFRPLLDSARAGLARLAPSHPTTASIFPANTASP